MASVKPSRARVQEVVNQYIKSGGDSRPLDQVAKEIDVPSRSLNRYINQYAAEYGLSLTSASVTNSTIKQSAIVSDDKIKTALMHHSMTLDQVAERYDISRGDALDACDRLKQLGVNVCKFGETYSIHHVPESRGEHVYVSNPGGYYKFGYTSDNHICFPPNTRIETEGGPKRISQIKAGDLVLTHKNRYRAVREVVVNPPSSDFIRLWFKGQNHGGSNASASFVSTPNHPVMVYRDGVDMWIPASEIREGDAVRMLATKKCKHCGAPTAPWSSVCLDCDPYKRKIDNSGRVRQWENGHESSSPKHYNEDIAPEMRKWEQDGFRVIDINRVRPDFLAIKDGKVIAVEAEGCLRGRARPLYEKYDIAGLRSQYDDVVWVEKHKIIKEENRTYSWLPANEYGFIAVPVSKVERYKASKPTKTYNLKVEEDESYVAKRCVVHNCSKYAREDVLSDLYDWFEDQGVDRVFNTGNYIDGEARFNKHDIFIYGMQNQLNYFCENYPQREGIKSYIVSGDDHEGWYGQREGVDIGWLMEQTARRYGREDLINLGYVESFVKLQHQEIETASSQILVVHPGGGSAYATSYAPQKYVEALQGGEKPAVILFGHWHKMFDLLIRNVICLGGGCTKDLDPFGRKNRLAYHLGGMICELWQDGNGAITRWRVEKKQFFDRGYYNNQWQYASRVPARDERIEA